MHSIHNLHSLHMKKITSKKIQTCNKTATGQRSRATMKNPNIQEGVF